MTLTVHQVLKQFRLFKKLSSVWSLTPDEILEDQNPETVLHGLFFLGTSLVVDASVYLVKPLGFY